ncbi:PEP-CTERM sorting domain-containing protein [Roseibacillus ishigakijimensis]|uniref:PEP-CTERM sorting domain-containing protein n=1 Tax=Roseibacillus ishigakijimensis TaxID=454146 RepID=A0A934RLW5_9BACT|nr:PEP-CTERM sorting domain-containing protein [Roseibacillus ishigakijimensis]MBK1833185.1 PEP-CTERM sorting domain-containing protein [Roseibacillus ishigakijimensis]
MNAHSPFILTVGSLWLGLSTTNAVNIVLDFVPSNNLFSGNATARAAVSQAASDISAALTNSLSPLATDTYTGTNGANSSTVDWRLQYTQPNSGNAVTLENPHSSPGFGLDEIKIYVGGRDLGGNTLGQGGPGGIGFNLGGTIGPGSFADAVDQMEALSDAAMLRGSGPVLYVQSTTFNGEDVTLQSGIFVGNLWFDTDTDNDGNTDSAAELGLSWHYDHTIGVAGGKIDLYTVALHEILHAIGFGIGESWNSQVSGNEWTGMEANSVYEGLGAVPIDGGHLAAGTMSTSIVDGSTQEAVMGPTLSAGQRKTLTELDLAILRDLGYETIPEPSSLSLCALGLLAVFRRRK